VILADKEADEDVAAPAVARCTQGHLSGGPAVGGTVGTMCLPMVLADLSVHTCLCTRHMGEARPYLTGARRTRNRVRDRTYML
jgi:hypothetical protein